MRRDENVLILFQSYYEALAMYRRDIIIQFGFLSMLIQATIFAWLYEKAFAMRRGGLWTKALAYGAVGALLSWSSPRLQLPRRTSWHRFRTICSSKPHSRSCNGRSSRP